MYKYYKDVLQHYSMSNTIEWYLPNGLGGYSSSTIINSTHRKHNAYLVISKNPPVDRYVLLQKTTEEVIIDNKLYSTKTNNITDFGNEYLESFSYNFIPTYEYKINNVLFKKIVCPKYNENTVVIKYSLYSKEKAIFKVIPYFTYHEHGSVSGRILKSKVINHSISLNEDIFEYYCHCSENTKIKNRENNLSETIHFLYDELTGDDRTDVFYTPYEIEIELLPNEKKEIYLVVSTEKNSQDGNKIINNYKNRQRKLIKKLNSSDELLKKLCISADTFICNRKSTNSKTILAGLPWFTDWGRDTMIAFTGLTLVTKRFKDAKSILKSFIKYENDGLIPNMFPDNNTKPLYNTVDASLWFFIAVHNYIKYLKLNGKSDEKFIREEVYPVLEHIIYYYEHGTKFSIKMDHDGLISAGSKLDQITWMDVRINDFVVTPRHGKPVEINALWYNALKIIEKIGKDLNKDVSHYSSLANLVKSSFSKFINPTNGYLYDVIDPYDDDIRPNALFIFSLPYELLNKDIQKNIFKIGTEELYNKIGIRSLSNKNSKYIGIYEGPLEKRDLAYHMGTSWGFLMGSYIDGYFKTLPEKDNCIINHQFIVQPLIEHLNDGCINGYAEIFDGDKFDRTLGCATQAWSVGEFIRTYYENFILSKNR